MSESVQTGDRQYAMEENEEGMDFAEPATIMSLPPEILIDIIGRLSPTDRAQCRLVSKVWYYSALNEQKERLCITKLYDDSLKEVCLTLSRSHRTHLHLEFHHLHLKNDDLSAEMAFWSKLESVKLKSCRVTGPTFQKILTHCLNIHTLDIQFPSVREMMNEGELSIECLRECVQHQPKNTSVQTLKIYFEKEYEKLDESLANECLLYYLEALCHLFDLFPNISNFSSRHRDGISYYAHFWGNARQIDEERESEYVARLHEYLCRDQMERIAIPWLGLNWNEWISFMKNLSQHTTKITEIIILDSDFESFQDDELLSRQTNLRNVTCVCSRGKDFYWLTGKFSQSAEQFIKFLRNVPSVRHLALRRALFPIPPEPEGPEHEELEPEGQEHDEPEPEGRENNGPEIPARENIIVDTSDDGSFPVLANITTCDIQAFDVASFDCILRFLPQLTDLRITHSTDSTFASICTNQRNLSFLKINSAGDLRSRITFLSSPNLQALKLPKRFALYPTDNCLGDHLKSLQFRDWDLRPLPDNPASPTPEQHNFVFDTLRIRGRKKLLPFRAVLGPYKSECPSLETACFDLDCQDFFPSADNDDGNRNAIIEAIILFVTDLKYLKYLYFSGGPKLTLVEVTSIFRHSRTLRVLVMADEIFFKHAIRNSVVHKTINDVNVRREFWESSCNFF